MNENKRLKMIAFYERREARQTRAEFYKQLAKERLEQFLQECELERRTEFMPGRPTPVDDPKLSSRIFGPQMRTTQYRRTIRPEEEKD